MADEFEGKKVPWSQFEQYLDFHKRKTEAIHNFLTEQVADQPTMEGMLPRPLCSIHESLTKMLRDNGITPQINGDQLQAIVKAVMKIQNKIANNMQSQKDIKAAIESMKSERKDALGQQIHEEISRGFIENISGITEIIKDNFSQIRESSQQHYEGLKNDIAELKAKDDHIKTLIQRETDLREEVKGKDEIIGALNRNIETLSHQKDQLSSEKDAAFNQLDSLLKEKDETIATLKRYFETLQQQYDALSIEKEVQIDKFQTINNELTTKNNDLQAQVKSFYQKAGKELQQQAAPQTQKVPEHQPSTLELLRFLNDKFLLNSNCANDIQKKLYLIQLLGNKRPVTVLLYRGSIHGWMAKDFHSRCDNKGPTISLFQVKDGDCIGGYTTAQWGYDSNGQSYYIGDIDAILFNLTRSLQFPSKRSGQDIRCDQICGPNFGGLQYSELATCEPFNNQEKCYSFANQGSYGIPLKDGVNILTSKKDGGFTISELEVWEITGYMLGDKFVKCDKKEIDRIREKKLKQVETQKQLKELETLLNQQDQQQVTQQELEQQLQEAQQELELQQNKRCYNQ